MDILIVKLGALGDVINTLPLVVNLRQRLDVNIHWLVEPLSYPLVAEHPCVDEAIIFDRNRWWWSLVQLAYHLRTNHYDIALDLQRIIKSSLFCQTASADRRIGFDRQRCKELSWIFPFEKIPASDPTGHMVFQYLEFATYLGLNELEVRWDIPIEGKYPFDLPREFIVLNIGASKPANLWQAEKFAELAEVIEERLHVYSVLTGGRQDIGMADRIMSSYKGNSIINLVGKTSILELKEILYASRIVVSADTGPMHLAVALGKPVIALFGPSDPRRTGPFRGHVVRHPIDCSPCNRRTCPDPLCMKCIKPSDVFERIERLWLAS